MDEATKEILNYGVLGAVVVILLFVIRFLYNEIKSEREKWNQTIQGNTDVLKELKRIFETTREKKR